MLRLGVDDSQDQDTKTLVRNSDTQRMGVAYGSGGSVPLPQRWQSTGLCGATFVTYYNIFKYIHAYIHTYIHTYIHAYAHECTHIYIYTHTQQLIYVCTYTNRFKYIRA